MRKPKKSRIFVDATSLGMLRSTEDGTGGGSGTTPPPEDGAQGANTGSGTEKPADKSKDDKADWEDKYQGQLKVNRDLETKLNALRSGLQSALGIEEKKVGSDELITTLQGQLAALLRDNQVNAAARRHGITKDEDLELLRAAKDEDALDKLAARLAPAQDDEASTKTPGKPGTPKPDPSQGRGGGSEGARPTSIAQVMADRRAAREKKTP